jgi:hypothetical protein
VGAGSNLNGFESRVESRIHQREPGEAAEGGQQYGRVDSLLCVFRCFFNGKGGGWGAWDDL